MPARNHTPNGAPIWADLLSSDIERTRSFYSQLFGWEASEPNEEFGGYVSFTNGAGLRMGGAMLREPGTRHLIPGRCTYRPMTRKKRWSQPSHTAARSTSNP